MEEKKSLSLDFYDCFLRGFAGTDGNTCFTSTISSQSKWITLLFVLISKGCSKIVPTIFSVKNAECRLVFPLFTPTCRIVLSSDKRSPRHEFNNRLEEKLLCLGSICPFSLITGKHEQTQDQRSAPGLVSH